MHGDPKYGPDFKYFDYVNPNAPKGGTIRQSALRTFNTFNPYTIKGDAAVGLGFLYESLMTSPQDEAFTEYGLIAESIEVPKDRSWATFELRKEARWHDAKPITVEDVIWSLNTLRKKGRPFYRFYYRDIAKVEKVGERKVKFTFGSTENRELPLIIGQLPILPKHYWENRDFEKMKQVAKWTKEAGIEVRGSFLIGLPGETVELAKQTVQNAIDQAKIAASTINKVASPIYQIPWFWSDQYNIKLKIAGVNSSYENYVVRGLSLIHI